MRGRISTGAIMGAGMIGLAFLAGCAGATEGEPRSRQGWVADGEPVNCISTAQIRSTHVLDDQTIHFVMSNRRMFRNELPFACSGLGFNRSFKHNSRTSQLCSSNSITVVQPGMRQGTGTSCPLGRFQPMKPVPAVEAPAETG